MKDKNTPHSGDSVVRVGIVNYLNTRPLLFGLQKLPISRQIELIEDNPAHLADMLLTGQIDLGLIPVAMLPEFKEYYIAGNYCIASDGEVASVCLFSEVPMAEIKKLYLDYQSRSSVALLKWLMKEYWDIHPELVQATDDSYREKIKGSTAGLVIGDRAFEQRKISTFIYDLGAEWRSITGLPFVFAVWVSNRKLSPDFIEEFNDANAFGLDHIDEIVADHTYDLYDLKNILPCTSIICLMKGKKGMEMFLQFIK